MFALRKALHHLNEKTRDGLGESLSDHIPDETPVPGIHKELSKCNNQKTKNAI